MIRSIGVKGVKDRATNVGCSRLKICHFPYGNGFFCTFHISLGEHFAIKEGMDRTDARRTTKDVIISDPVDYVTPMDILDKTTHRDGSIYKKNLGFLELFHITNRDESKYLSNLLPFFVICTSGEARLEPMMLSEPNTDCVLDQKRCIWHGPSRMMQIFSLKLVQIPIGNNSIKLYGYIAVRDYQDSLLNYIFYRSRDNPVVVHQGSLIEMTGPKQGITMCATVLLEFDTRIKGEKEEDDLQLIDGASEFSEFAPCCMITGRINGECGAVDISSALVDNAVEATIEVEISKVQNAFNLSLSSFVFIDGLHEEIQLFHGTIGEPCSRRRFVIAVEINTWMHLKFKIGQKGSKNYLERYFSFEASNHGCNYQQVMRDLASISAKVWIHHACINHSVRSPRTISNPIIPSRLHASSTRPLSTAFDEMLHSWRHLNRVSRSVYGSTMRVKDLKEKGKHFATKEGMDRAEARRTTKDVILGDPVDYVTPKCVIDKTTHRDGSIYKKNLGFLKLFHITNRDETRLEPMMLSEPNTDCEPDQEMCFRHSPTHMMQIFSLKLAQIPIGSNSVELYGYIAARDSQDSLLNYILKCSRHDPIVLQQVPT
ncbi:hypothetical protein EJB05_41990, partial [Eragrostis curvula]